nr:MAG TPA: Baseplate wedge protein [Caudoviricetes sp.]
MAQFPILRLTHAGQEMAGMSQGGGKLTFVRVELGDGQLKEEDSIEALTDLKRSVMQLPLQGYLNEGNGKARLRFVIDNSALTVGFHNREVGIFAKIDSGAERLYAYTNAGNYADWIPSKETPIDGDIVDLHIVIGNAANVTIQTVSGAYATKIELEEHRTASELDHPEKSVRKKHLHPDAYESPALTGTPIAPTAGRGTNNDQIATTAFVAQAIAALVNSAPGALDTLQELAAALGNDANFAATVTNALAGKLGKTEKAASAGNSDTLGGQSLQWVINQINAAKTGIVASNIAPNGWVKFANGLIVQWGMGSEQLSEATQTVIFPITFSRGCFSLITGTILSVAGIRNDSMWQVATVERERAVLFHQHFTPDGIGKTKPTYIAIGV